MNTYLWMKTLHIISSVLLVGTGLGTAYYLFFANRSGSLEAQAVVGKLVVKADWLFTTPAIIIQPLSGLWLAQAAGWPLSAPWLTTAIALYVFAGACWLPVVALQIRMAKTANACCQQGNTELPPSYWQDARWWERLGYPAFLAMALVYYLMVFKPPLWA